MCYFTVLKLFHFSSAEGVGVRDSQRKKRKNKQCSLSCRIFIHWPLDHVLFVVKRNVNTRVTAESGLFP